MRCAVLAFLLLPGPGRSPAQAGPPPRLLDLARNAGWPRDGSATGAALFTLALAHPGGATLRSGAGHDLCKSAVIRLRDFVLTADPTCDARQLALAALALSESAVHAEYRLLAKPALAARAALGSRLRDPRPCTPRALAWAAVATLAMQRASSSAVLGADPRDDVVALCDGIDAQLERVPPDAADRVGAMLAAKLARLGAAAADEPGFALAAATFDADDVEPLTALALALGMVAQDPRLADAGARLASRLARLVASRGPADAVEHRALFELAALVTDGRSFVVRGDAPLVVTVTHDDGPLTTGWVSVTSHAGSALWQGAELDADGRATFRYAPPGAFTLEWCSSRPLWWAIDEPLPEVRVALDGARTTAGAPGIELARSVPTRAVRRFIRRR